MATAAVIIIHKEKEIVAACRRAGATNAASARTLAALGVHQGVAVDRLKRRAVLREAAPGSYYLDEPSWEALRGIRRRIGLAMLFVILVAFIAFAVLPRS
jgi:hypothetical protein